MGSLGAYFHIWAHWPKMNKCHKLKHFGLLGVLNTLLALSYPGETDYDFSKYKFSVKFLICAYWTKNVTGLRIWVCKHVIYSIYYFPGFSKYVFFKTFFWLELCNFLTSEIKSATYKIATIKMYLFWRTIATFSQFFLTQCNILTGRENECNAKLEDRIN